MTDKHILIIGAGYAGLMAALRLHKEAPKHGARITLINAGDSFVERIRLHQQLVGQALPRYAIADFLRGTGIQFVQGFVQAILPDEQCVRVQTGAGMRDLPYYRLVLATGSKTDTNAIPGIQEHAHTLDEKSVQALRATLPKIAARGGTVQVIGAGLTGIEAATELAETFPGLKVYLITRSRLGKDLSEKARMKLQKRFAAMGIRVLENTAVRTVENGYTITETGAQLPFDACVWAGGFVANALARENGLSVNARNQVRVNAAMQSLSHPAIYATGDAAAFLPEAGIHIRMSCATAMPMGAHLADNLLRELRGDSVEAFSYRYAVRCISLGRDDALVQIVNGDDSLKERVITGRTGAMVKEAICKYTIKMMQIERRFPGFYPWFKGNRFEDIMQEFKLENAMS